MTLVPSVDAVNALIKAAGDASAAADPAKQNAEAAFDALVTLVGQARVNKIDFPTALAELRA